MSRRPYGRDAGLLTRRLWERQALSGVVMSAGALAIFRWELDRTGSLETAQTAALTTMMMCQMAQAFNARAGERSLFRTNPLGNQLLVLTVGVTIAVHLAAMWLGATQTLLRIEPLGAGTWLEIAGAVAALILAVELHKAIRRRRDPESSGEASSPSTDERT